MARGQLNEKQEKYCQSRARGVGKRQSAILAGYAEYDKVGEQIEESDDVRYRIAELQQATVRATGITKEMVAEGLKDAADMAKTLADPTGMVAAWRELGKMLGFYAPEVKKIERGISKGDLLRAMEQLSDEELLRMSRGKVIEGEFRRIPEDVPALSKIDT